MDQSQNNGFTCPDCGHFYKGHTNVFGKVCIHCGARIPPPVDPKMVERNKISEALAQQYARQVIAAKVTAGDLRKRVDIPFPTLEADKKKEE